MFNLFKQIATIVAIAGFCSALSGCLIREVLGQFSKSSSGGYDVAITANTQTAYCEVNLGTNVQDCTYTDDKGVTTDSTVTLGGAELLFVKLFDPLVAQVPANATGISGTFDNGNGLSGALVITTGLASIPADANTNLVAQPGQQLIIVDFPPGTPPGDYRFTFRLTAANPLIRPMFTGKVQVGGTTYYPPLMPCTTDFSKVPSFVFTSPGSAIPLLTPAYLAQVQGCSQKAYTFPSGTGPTAVDVVEYYNASLDHYFITWVPNEIAILDAGVTIRGWVRTGKTFKTYTTAQPNSSPICRFYIPPGLGDSHFFGRGTAECNETAQKFPLLILEDPAFMHMFLPTAGACPPNTTEVHRAFSNRTDANHRYTTDLAVLNQMVAMHWLAEGDGPDLVVMCAPQ